LFKEEALRRKTITIDCGTCEFCSADDQGQFMCSWGKGKPKIMKDAKGKRVIKCNLINKGKK